MPQTKIATGSIGTTAAWTSRGTGTGKVTSAVSVAPEALFITRETVERETPATRRLYGMDRPDTAEFGTRCLLARRMVERGVRFVQMYCGDTNGWDAHTDVVGNHGKLCAQMDLPVAGLSASAGAKLIAG